MSDKQEYVSNDLSIHVDGEGETINVLWLGKSTERTPGRFISPILQSVLDQASGAGKRVVLDFRKLGYMNSSTVTPLIHFLEMARRSQCQISIMYDKSARWQDLSFSALRVFVTQDNRIRIEGT